MFRVRWTHADRRQHLPPFQIDPVLLAPGRNTVVVEMLPTHVYAGALGAGALCVGLYACHLWQLKLQMRRNQMYMDAFVRALELAVKVRGSGRR